MARAKGNRRIDRVLDPEYLADLPGRTLDEVRRMRREAEQEETDLSYLRRMLQGRIDILRAEESRRSGEDASGAATRLSADEAAASLVDRLASILAEADRPGPPRGLGRHLSVDPPPTPHHRRYVERLVDDADISDPTALSDEALRRALETLETEERKISEQRRAVQAVMDKCTAEIARRYREGDVDLDELLPTDSR